VVIETGVVEILSVLVWVELVGEMLVNDGELDSLLLVSSNVNAGVTWWNADLATQIGSTSFSFSPAGFRSKSGLFLLVSCCCGCAVTGATLRAVGEDLLLMPWSELMRDVSGWAMWAEPSSRGLMFKLKLKLGLRPLTPPETGREGNRFGGGVGSPEGG